MLHRLDNKQIQMLPHLENEKIMMQMLHRPENRIMIENDIPIQNIQRNRRR